MFTFYSIKELINTLAWAKDLLSEMFEKRKTFVYQYEQALEVIEENKLDALIAKGLVRRNGNFVYIDDLFLEFFEQILEVNEEVNTSYIHENIQQIKQNINYYFQENNEGRKYRYLKTVKYGLRKIGVITIRNVGDLSRNIENTFKTEPSYKIKIAKLENLDQKREDITHLIELTEKLLSEEEITFFKAATDEELKQITILLRFQLQDARHNLIEIQKQIIDFLNQIRYQSKILEKIRHLKYLKDQFEIRNKTNIVQLLNQSNAAVFESKPLYRLNLSLNSLQDDDVYERILAVCRRINSGIQPQLALAKNIGEEYLRAETEEAIISDWEGVKNGFFASGTHLFDFVIHYDYSRELSFEEKLTVFCWIISIYETELTISDGYGRYKDTEYAIVFPK